MAKKKYYAVKKGLAPGIYASWEECQQNINGFPGAEYRGFPSREEADAYLSGDENNSTDDTIERIHSSEDAVAYIDGAVNEETNEYSCGVVLFFDGGEEHFAEKYSDENMIKMGNVAGEIQGAKRAMKFCHQKEIRSLELFYCNDGIEKWCTQEWRAKHIGSQEYRKYYNTISKSVDVHFVQVKNNLRNKYNDLAKSLAKAALGLDTGKTSIIERDSGVIAKGIKKKDLESVIEIMEEDFSGLTVATESIPYGTKYLLDIAKPTKQHLTINYYTEKEKVWISGRKEDLFQCLTLYIVELLEEDEISSFLNTIHSLNIDKDVVESEFISLLPNSYDKLPETIGKYLRQAVYNLHIEGAVYVSNYLVEPAIRPLEGMLKMVLKTNGIPIRQDEQNWDSFYVFKKSNGKYKLQEEFIKDEHSDGLIKYLNKCYNFYHNNRHTLFHWDDPTENVDTTRILHSTAEARAIIQDAIALIDEYYSLN